MSSAVGEMNLAELKAAYPALFYGQDWYVREPFMRTLPDPYRQSVPPRCVVRVGRLPLLSAANKLPSAVDLAHAFVLFPSDPIWEHFLWTSDTDLKGQRVYVGGATESNGRRLEIHRHLHITEQFGEASWR